LGCTQQDASETAGRIFNCKIIFWRRRWEDNIKMDLQEVGCGVTDWIKLAQDSERWQAPVNAIMNLWVP
jgi:hypothetical protein